MTTGPAITVVLLLALALGMATAAWRDTLPFGATSGLFLLALLAAVAAVLRLEGAL